MKNFILGVTATLMLSGTMAYAGLFDSIRTSDWDVVESSPYLVEALGFDIRAYDFRNTEGDLCTAVFGNNGPVGVGCVPK